MRIVIDLQPLQTESSKRGIGRYTKSFITKLIQLHSTNENAFILLFKNEPLSKELLEYVESLNSISHSLHRVSLPAPDTIDYVSPINRNFMKGAELVRERFIEALKPDILIITSLFEFDAVVSVTAKEHRSYLTSIILYDLIPLENPEGYLDNPNVSHWYFDKIDMLHKADTYLCISKYTLDQAVDLIGIRSESCVNISGASDLVDSQHSNSATDSQLLSEIRKDYILYVGGFDSRKNVKSLIKAYTALSDNIQSHYTLILAGSISELEKMELKKAYRKNNGHTENIVYLGYINDQTLIELYKNCALFVFPSINEGFGLPPLEAMGFGAAVIAANRASLPEVIANENALFDPDNEDQFREILTRALSDESFRNSLVAHSIKHHKLFSWEKSAETGFNFIRKKYFELIQSEANYIEPRKEAFYSGIASFCNGDQELMKMSKLIASTIHETKKLLTTKQIHDIPKALTMTNSFNDDIPDYKHLDAPYAFSSMLCREQHFHLPLYTFWCDKLKETPRFHRKQWEFVYICQSLYERGYIREGLSAVGFGVGKEPIVSFFASQGLTVMATDLDFENAKELGWVDTDQHSDNLLSLNELNICPNEIFLNNTQFRNVDMNNIPNDIGTYDICWSSCAFEHLGSIRKGLDFVKNSCRLLKPGGIAVHTTEFNLSSNDKTLDNNPSFVIFRKKDIELLSKELRDEGFIVEPIDFSSGEDELEQYVDMPPYVDEPHIRLELAGKYVSTSLGIIIRKPKEKS